MSNEMNGKKYCKYCGEIIDEDCIICPKCGKQIEQIQIQQPIYQQQRMIRKKIKYSVGLDLFMFFFLTPIWLIWVLFRPKYELVPETEEYIDDNKK